jgi:hypothetical protein
MIKQRSAKNGFTILEMSLILMAVGFLVGTYLSFYRPNNTAQATIQTQLKIDRTLNAVSNFAMRNDNRRLPCPGRATDNDGNLGREVCPGGADPVLYDIIPYKALGLSQEDAKDGFGFYMTYVVFRGAVTAGGGTRADELNVSRFCDAGLVSPLTVNNNGVNEQAFVAVISHGADGRGSYNVMTSPPTERYNAAGLGVAEANNANKDNALIIAAYNPTNINPANPSNRHADFFFDDMIGFMTQRGVIDRVSIRGCY